MNIQTDIKVSVIITTYNRSIYLKETLNSIQNQTIQNIEILVIDDGSKPEISSQIKQICNQFSKCSYYYKSNTGQPSSRNYGIKKAKGNFIGFCDDDDYWVLDKLEKQIDILNKNQDVDIVVGNIEYVDANSKSLNIIKSHFPYNNGYVFENFLIKNRTDSVTPLLRKEIFKKTGFFNPNFTISEDWDFWRKASFFHKFYALDEVLAYIRKHDHNMTSQKRTHIDGLELYHKITLSLLKWGEDKFTLKQKNKILYIEYLHYRKYFGNYHAGLYKKAIFAVKLFLYRPTLFVRILKTALKKFNYEAEQKN